MSFPQIFDSGREERGAAEYPDSNTMIIHPDTFCNWGVAKRHGFLKNNEELLILRKGTAKSAKSAKFFDFLCVLRGLGGSKLLSDINLRKPWAKRMGYVFSHRGEHRLRKRTEILKRFSLWSPW